MGLFVIVGLLLVVIVGKLSSQYVQIFHCRMRDRVIMRHSNDVMNGGNKQVLNSTFEMATLRMLKLQSHRLLNTFFCRKSFLKSFLCMVVILDAEYFQQELTVEMSIYRNSNDHC